MANEALILSIKADIDQAIKQFQNLDSVIAGIKTQAKEAQKSLGLVNQASAKTSGGGAGKNPYADQIATWKRLLKEQDNTFKQEIANARKTAQERVKISRDASNQLRAIEAQIAKDQQARAKITWQSQIKTFKPDPLIMQQAKVVEQAEKAKQKAMLETMRIQQRADQQQSKEKQSFTNRILGGIAPGLGAGVAVAGVMALQGAVQKLGQEMQRGIDFNAYLEANTAMFKVILKDGPKATQLLSTLQTEALKTSLNFKESVISTKQLLAYGFELGKIIPTMKMLGTVTSATGGSLDDLAYVYGTLRTQGRAYTRDLMQFAMRGIPIYENLAQVMGVPVEQIKKITEEGKVGFAEVEQAFIRMTSQGGVYFGAMEARMQTFTGMVELLEKKTEIMWGNMAKSLEEPTKKIITQLTNIVDHVNNAINAFDRWSNGDQKGRKGTATDSTASVGAQQEATGQYIKQAMYDSMSDRDKMLSAIMQWTINSIKPFIGTRSEAVSPATPQQIEKDLQAVKKYATELGKDQVSVAEAMYAKSLITLEAFQQIAQQAIIAEKAMKGNKGLVAMGNIGGIGKALGIDISRAYTDPHAKNAASFQAGTMLIEDQKDKDAVKASLKYAKSLGMSQEFMDKMAQDFDDKIETIVSNGFALLGEGNLDPSTKKQVEEYIRGLTGMAFGDITPGAGKKAKDLAPDPLLYEKMMAEGSFSDVDNVQLEYIQSLSSLTKAYQDAGITGEKLTNAQDLLAKQFDIRAKEAQARSASTGSQAEIADQIERVLALREQQTKARNLAEGARTVMESTGGYKEDGNNATYLQFLIFAKQGEEALARFTKEVDEAQEELGRLTQGTLSDFQKLTLADLQTKIAGVGKDDAGSQIAMVQSAHELEMNNKFIEHDTALKMAQATYDKASSDEQSKMALDIKYMIDKYNLEESLAKKLNDEQIKQIQRQADLKDYEVGMGGDPKYWEDIKINAIKAFKAGNVGAGASSMAKGTLQGTDAGMFMSGGNPWMILISALLKAAMSLESVQKLLNGFTGMLAKAVKGAEPLIASMNEVFNNIFEMLGPVLGPIIAVLSLLNSILTPFVYLVIAPVIAALQMLAKVLTMFADFVIDNVINPIIDFVNGFIVMLNTLFGWLGVNIKLLSHVMNSSAQAMADAEKELQKIKLKEYGDALSSAIDYLRNKINEQADKMVTSAQNLLDVGAISASEYSNRFDQAQTYKQNVDPTYQLLKQYFPEVLNKDLSIDEQMAMYYDLMAKEKEWSKKNEEEQLIALKNIEANTYAYLSPAQQDIANKQQAEALKMIAGVQEYITDVADGDYSATQGSAQATVDAWNNGDVLGVIGNSIATTTTAVVETIGNIFSGIGSLFGFAVGTPNIPKDMIAQVHKGEGIVPATFMDAIRSGDLTLSGGSGTVGGSGDTYIVTVNVSGSVTTERDLVTSISQTLYKQRKMGALTT